MPDLESEVEGPVGSRPSHHRSEWRLHRVGWAIMAMFLLAALAGLFGGGLLSDATATSQDGRLTVEYERFVRGGGESQLTIRASARDGEDGPVRIALDQGFLTRNEVRSISPEPAAVVASGDRLLYEFDAAAGSSLVVRMDLRPSAGDYGANEATVTDGSGQSVQLWQFVYP